MIKTAIFPGSFAPFTLGHKSIVDRMLPLFDKIIIFNNEDSLSHTLDEGNDYYEKMNIVTDKYKDKVYVINFPYSTFEGLWWNNIQRASLHISLTALFNKCNFCSYS